jgi:hypothetical protein
MQTVCGVVDGKVTGVVARTSGTWCGAIMHEWDGPEQGTTASMVVDMHERMQNVTDAHGN